MPTKVFDHKMKKGSNSNSKRQEKSGIAKLLFPKLRNKNLINFQEKTQYYNFSDFPSSLKNKIKILISVSKKMECENWEDMQKQYKECIEKREQNKEVEIVTKNNFKMNPECLNMVKLSKVIFGKNFSLFFLSNGNFQAIFADQLEIFFCRDSYSIFVTKDKDFNMNYSVNNFLLIDNIDLWKRISYINNVVQTIQGNQFDMDTKHAGIKVN